MNRPHLPPFFVSLDRPTMKQLIGARRLARYPGWVSRAMFRYARVPVEAPITTGATLYRLTYRTVDAAGATAEASGLVAVPRDLPLRGVVAYLHGTSMLRNEVPSAPTLEGRLIGTGFAGARYLLVAPDYLGLGISTAQHPYLHVAGTVPATVDLLRAAREFCQNERIVWPENLHLVGVSLAYGSLRRLSTGRP